MAASIVSFGMLHSGLFVASVVLICIPIVIALIQSLLLWKFYIYETPKFLMIHKQRELVMRNSIINIRL
jgi:hypothetical protein